MEKNISYCEEIRPLTKLSALFARLRQIIEDLFEEKYEDNEAINYAGRYIKRLPASPVKKNTPQKVYAHPELVSFLNLALGLLLTIPVLAWVGRHWIIPHIFLGRDLWPALALSGAAIFFILYLILQSFWKFMYGLLAGMIIVLGINQYRQESYDFAALYRDYRSWIVIKHQHVGLPEAGSISYARQISRKLKVKVKSNYKHFRIRKLVKDHTQNMEECPEENLPIQKWENCISLFGAIRKDWQYAFDPPDRDVFRSPGRTARIMRGDCDDWATFVAALYLQMDCEVRIIITQGHAYPELAIPTEEMFRQIVAPMIRSLDSYLAGEQEPLCYHMDPEGRIWLNMDFTAPYPGAPFLHEEVYEIVRF